MAWRESRGGNKHGGADVRILYCVHIRRLAWCLL